jgi:ubiquitin-protein ligase
MRRNIFEWHFSFLGVEGSPFAGGTYHGTILLDKKYPRKAPTISINTPSGRWKVDTNICLSGKKATASCTC